MPKRTVPAVAAAQRSHQRLRTRKDLLAAAARLLKQGRTPTDMDEVAAEAMVSRATAYRYFPSIEALLVEAPLDGAMPDADEIFAGDVSTDPVQRIDTAEAAMHAMCYRNEAQLRVMLATALQRQATSGPTPSTATARSGAVPVRQNRRTPLIEAALAPARDRFTDEVYEKLCASLAMIFGLESMIVFTDVLVHDETTARRTKSWAARALVRAALNESARSKPSDDVPAVGSRVTRTPRAPR